MAGVRSVGYRFPPPMLSSAPLLSLIGHTPLLPLHFPAEGLTIYAKAEFLNPSGSIKDRLAVSIIDDAARCGQLTKNSIILECTSGNTGISFAMVGAIRGYRVCILMSDTASVERRHLIRQFGAELILFKATKGYETGLELAESMGARDSRYFLPRQFENPLNARDHEENTGQEIWSQMHGLIDAFVSGYGTGGTLTGCGRALRAHDPRVRVVAMELAEDPVLSGEVPCCHTIEGVARGFVPPLLRTAKLDERVKVSTADALAMTRRLSREFGLLVGVSSGANVCAALRVARNLGASSRVVTILCDRAERYYSTRLFTDYDAANKTPAQGSHVFADTLVTK